MTHPESYPGAPRWVKVMGIIAVVVGLLILLFLATGGPGGHGPGRHASPAEQGLPQP